MQKLHCDTREKFVVTMNLLMHVLHDVPLYLAADPPGRTPTKVEKKSPGGSDDYVSGLRLIPAQAL